MKVAVYLDVSNLYYCVQKKFGRGRKLDYRKFLDSVRDHGEIVSAKAFGAQMGTEAHGFITCLKSMGIIPIYKEVKQYDHADGISRKGDQDVNIAVDMITSLDEYDLVVLASADCDMLPAVEHVLNNGKEVLVMAVGISGDLKAKATYSIEIPESLLE